MNITVVQLFQALGGRQKIAKLLGVGITAVGNWCIANKIPCIYFLDLRKTVCAELPDLPLIEFEELFTFVRRSRIEVDPPADDFSTGLVGSSG